MPKQPPTAASFDQTYPTLSAWVREYGRIEIGYTDYSHALVRAVDFGGWLWEAQSDYASLDRAFQELEVALTEWMEDNGGT